MALTWDLSKCDPAIREEDEWAVTETLIWLSMPLGYGKITEKNAADVYAAVALYERIAGTMVRMPDGSPYSITTSDVRRRIGLVTNAVNGKSPAANITRIAKDRLRELAAQYRADDEAEALV